MSVPLSSAPPLSDFSHLPQVMSAVPDHAVTVGIDDDRKLEELGYIPSFKREFSNLATVRGSLSHVFVRSPPMVTVESHSDQLCIQYHGIFISPKEETQ